MKKLISCVTVALAVGMSGSAMAATTWGDTNNTKTVTGGINGDCPLLGSDVKLTTSAHVNGGYACDEGNNIIQVAACHQGGSRDAVSCSTYDASSNPIDGCSDQTGSGTPNFKAFWASSEGGVMQTKTLDTRCNNGTLGALDSWAN